MAIAEITKGGREGGGKGRVEKYGTEQRQVKTQIPTQGSIYWGVGGKLLPQTLKLPPKKFSQMQFKIMA